MKRNHLILLSTAVALGLGLPAAAYAGDSGFYVGALVGRSSYDIPSADVATGTIDLTPINGGPVTSVTVTSSTLDKNDTAFGVTVGYQFMKYVAVEASYLNLGKAKLSAAGTYTQAGTGQQPFTAGGEFKSDGGAATVVGILPFGQGWSVEARLGGYFETTKYTVTGSDATGSVSGSESKTNSHLLAGAGVGYAFNDNWSVHVDYLYIDKVGDKNIYQTNVNMFSGGVRFKF